MPGHGAAVVFAEENIYLSVTLRNGGAGVAVIHGWRARAEGLSAPQEMPPLDEFRRQLRDLYIPAGHLGFWQGALRDPKDPDYPVLAGAAAKGERISVDLLYGDQFGGQRTVMRIGITDWEEVEGMRAEIGRYWNVDGRDPR